MIIVWCVEKCLLELDVVTSALLACRAMARPNIYIEHYICIKDNTILLGYSKFIAYLSSSHFMTILKLLTIDLSLKSYSGGGPVHARVPIHAHPQFS